MAVRVGGRGLYEAPGRMRASAKDGAACRPHLAQDRSSDAADCGPCGAGEAGIRPACAAPKKHLRFSEAVSLRRVRSGLRPKIAEAGERLTKENVPRRK